MTSPLRPAVVLLASLSLLTGVVYPAVVTGIAQAVFSPEANGSLLTRRGEITGSSLVGQPFDDPRYFWGRLSATGPFPYNASASSGSNLGPTNQKLRDAAEARLRALRAADPTNTEPVPVELLTASASGLDPHISPAGARFQIQRVAAARRLPVSTVTSLVEAHTTGRALGFLGEPVVNVLALNLALDARPRPAAE